MCLYEIFKTYNKIFGDMNHYRKFEIEEENGVRTYDAQVCMIMQILHYRFKMA